MREVFYGVTFVDAVALGFAFACPYCDDLVDGLSEPATEDGNAHLACVSAAPRIETETCSISQVGPARERGPPRSPSHPLGARHGDVTGPPAVGVSTSVSESTEPRKRNPRRASP
jgi:hypothetical protein